MRIFFAVVILLLGLVAALSQMAWIAVGIPVGAVLGAVGLWMFLDRNFTRAKTLIALLLVLLALVYYVNWIVSTRQNLVELGEAGTPRGIQEASQ